MREMSNWARNYHLTTKDALQGQAAKFDDLSRRIITLETSVHRLAPCETYGPRLATADARLGTATLQVEAQDRKIAEQERRIMECEQKASYHEKMLTDLNRRLSEEEKKAEQRDAQRVVQLAQLDNNIQELRRYFWRLANSSSSRSRGRERSGDTSRNKSHCRSDRSSVEPADLIV